MNDAIVKFENIPWEFPIDGMQQKVFSDGIQKMRLVKFSDNFIEPNWCIKNHLGYILDGELLINFNGTTTRFTSGDGLCIVGAENSKHKVLIEPGNQATLILFESI